MEVRPRSAALTVTDPAIIGAMAGENESDEELMRRFATGEAAAFEALYLRHERRIWRYLKCVVNNPALAEELMQDVWFAVARQAPSYAPTARFTTWLYTLAHNRAIDTLRARRPQLSLDDLDRDDPACNEALIADRAAEPDRAAAADDELKRVATAIDQLPAEQRAAFLLHVDGDLRVEEIAAVTKTSFETTKSRLRYARTRLRHLLSEDA